MKKVAIVFIVFLFLGVSLNLSVNSRTEQEIQSTGEEDWYYLPSFPNYAPSGMPDFSQRQDNWVSSWGMWTFCGPTALADVLWWFDSKHANQNGQPGDGLDTFPLVEDFEAPGTATPGPHSDDHNFNNVNDVETPWEERHTGELIEQLAWYVNTNRCRYFFTDRPGTGFFYMKWGIKKWIRDVGLDDVFKVETIFRPSFSTINERLRNNEGIILRLGFYTHEPNWFPLFFNHQVAVAGINSDGYIAVSDPDWDIANPSSDPTEHNDAAIVSHDIYEVSFSSPSPLISSWWIPEYAYHRRVVVLAATIISEIDQ
jgi:hypothetical protein